MKNIPPSLLELSAILPVVTDLRRMVTYMVSSGIVVLLITTHLFAKQDVNLRLIAKKSLDKILESYRTTGRRLYNSNQQPFITLKLQKLIFHTTMIPSMMSFVKKGLAPFGEM